jgi:hypothetical protein
VVSRSRRCVGVGVGRWVGCWRQGWPGLTRHCESAVAAGGSRGRRLALVGWLIMDDPLRPRPVGGAVAAAPWPPSRRRQVGRRRAAPWQAPAGGLGVDRRPARRSRFASARASPAARFATCSWLAVPALARSPARGCAVGERYGGRWRTWPPPPNLTRAVARQLRSRKVGPRPSIDRPDAVDGFDKNSSPPLGVAGSGAVAERGWRSTGDPTARAVGPVSPSHHPGLTCRRSRTGAGPDSCTRSRTSSGYPPRRAAEPGRVRLLPSAPLRAARGPASRSRDTIVNRNARQPRAATRGHRVYEGLVNAGLVPAAVQTLTCYRGAARLHGPEGAECCAELRARAAAVLLYKTCSSPDCDRARRRRPAEPRCAGSFERLRDSRVGRWLVTRRRLRTFLVYYLLGSTTLASAWPTGPTPPTWPWRGATPRSGRSPPFPARGGPAGFGRLSASGTRFVVLCRPRAGVRRAGGAVSRCKRFARRRDGRARQKYPASYRAGQVYALWHRALDALRPLAIRAWNGDGVRPWMVALFPRGRVRPWARREGGGAAFVRTEGDGWSLPTCDASILRPHRTALERLVARALANPNAGEVLLSAAPGWEFRRPGGRSHSAAAPRLARHGDSGGAVLTVGIEGEPRSSRLTPMCSSTRRWRRRPTRGRSRAA